MSSVEPVPPSLSGDVSRRRFLGSGTAGVAAYAVFIAGCQQTQGKAKAPPLMFNAAQVDDAPAAASHDDDDEDWPAVSYAEGVEAVRQFEEKLKVVYYPKGSIHTVMLATSKNKPTISIEVRYAPDKGKPALPEQFDYFPPNSKEPRTVPVDVRPEPVPKPHGVKLGQPAVAAVLPSAQAGSVGWTIKFNDRVVCVSAYHVLRDRVNPTGGIGDNVKLNDVLNADLHCYQPIKFDGSANTWDVAMALYRNAADADRAFRSCDDGYKPSSYPMKLSSAPTTGEWFNKVGNGSPVCGTGKYVGTGSCAVEFTTDQIAVFKGQLFFTKFAGPGDSGAVITRTDDLSVTGLHFTGTSTRSISCPLFLMPWNRQSSNHTLPSGQQIPSFTADSVAAPACCR